MELIELHNLGVETWKAKRVIYNKIITYEVMIWVYLSNIDFLIQPYQDVMISHTLKQFSWSELSRYDI